jgi:glycosyltransferase involved in cell wall biosynthesis
MFLYGRSWIAGLLPGLAILRRAGVGPVVTMHQVVDPGTVDASFVELHRVRVSPAVARAGIIGVQEAIRRLAATTIVHEASFANTLCGATVVPHGMELGSPPDREQARRRLRADSRLMVLCFGYVAPYKGLEAALEAARLARDEVNLVIAGGPHPRLAEGEEYRQELIREFGEFARFTGHVPPQDVSSWFAATDVALLPYPRPFSSSGALALALAHRTPALLSSELARAIAAPPRMATSIEPDRLAARLAGLRDVSKIEMLRCDSDVLARDREWPTVARRHLALYREVSDASGTPDRRFRAA